MKRLGGTFSRLLDELVRERTGLASSRRHEEVKERVLTKAMARAGVSDEAVYLALLKRDRKAYDDLIADLTVPETYFFRDPAHYELLRRSVLPAILAAHDHDHVLELWSAGCASGEEPYSLAMLLEQEQLGKRSHVLGTDVSHRALSRAMEAVYTRWSLRATGPVDRERYFESIGTEFRLIPRIRSRPRFLQHSLSAPVYPAPHTRNGGFDLILCRNVMIYFDPQAIIDTSQRLARSLNEDGFLMMGPSDPRLELEEWCDAVPTPCGMLYHRRRTSAHQWPLSHDHGLEPSWRAPHVWHSQASSTRNARAQRDTGIATPPRIEELPRRAFSSQQAAPPDAALAPRIEFDPAEQVRALEREHGSLAAEAGCRDLLATEPLSAGLHVLHATLLLDLGRDELAAQALRRALYLDRSLLIAQLVGATLAERRGERTAARACYLQLVEACEERPQDEPVTLGEGLTYASLGALALQRATALSGQRDQARDA